MKRVHNQIEDFLEIDDARVGRDTLWRAGWPTEVEEIEGDLRISIPFRERLPSDEMSSGDSVKEQERPLWIRAYGSNTLRIYLGESGMGIDSPMFAWDSEMEPSGLEIDKSVKGEWRILDNEEVLRGVIYFKEPKIDHWSDLLPPPETYFEAVFYPDGEREVRIHAYDQFFPARQDAVGLGMIERDGVLHRTTFSFHAEANECFAGTGERFMKMDLSGQTFQLDNQDGQGVNSRRTYKNIPFYLSSRLYGAFLHTSAYSKFSLADHSTRSVQILTETPDLDLFLMGGGTPERIINEYRKITGYPAVPPLWSYGIWMSRMTYFSETEVKEICKRLREEDYPCDVIHLDTGWFETDWLCEWKFNEARFPDPERFMEDLRKDGFKVSLWQMPYIAADAEQHDEAAANRFIAPLSESQAQGGSNFSALDYAGTIDFTKPDAVTWYQNLLRRLLEMGAVCIKTDFGEEIHMEADYYGMPAETLKNLYPLLYQRAAYEVTREITGEGIIWARAGWAGCQRYPLHWGGDAAATWDGFAGSLKGGLHLGVSGFGFWSHDVPGFHGLPNFMNSVIPQNLYVRWTQFGVFTSHIRYHGTSKREPYHFPEIADIVRWWWKLRYALIPYFMEQSGIVAQSGFPVLRALLMHHPEDPVCWHIQDQYYCGNDFLVCPVMNAESKRHVYIPCGRWVHLFTGECIEGPQWILDMEIPLAEMPVWVRYGARVPVYPYNVDSTDDMDFDHVITVNFDDSYPGLASSELGDLLPVS